MPKSEWALLALNAAAVFAAFVGSVEPDDDVAVFVFLVVLAAAVANGVYVVRRGRERPAVRRRARKAAPEALDARQVLELDERLEALERREERVLRLLAARADGPGPHAEEDREGAPVPAPGAELVPGVARDARAQ